MSILDTLRKLGILSYGAKAAVYHDAKSRPTEFMMDDFHNTEKDLTGKNDHLAEDHHWGSSGVTDD